MLTHNDVAQTTGPSIHQNAQRPVGLATAQTSNHDPAQRPKSTGRNNPCRAAEPSRQPNSLSPNKFGTAHTTACSSTANHISAGRDSPRTSPHSQVSWLDGGPALLAISRGGWRC